MHSEFIQILIVFLYFKKIDLTKRDELTNYLLTEPLLTEDGNIIVNHLTIMYILN
jgi:hypothetical protein